MSYFGGLGAGKGWHKFKFILTPDEFKSLFDESNFYFVVANSRVDINYSHTEIDYIFSGYQKYFEEILIGQNIDDRKKVFEKKEYEFVSKIRISIIGSLEKMYFVDCLERNKDVSTEFKLVEFTEPVINISPFYLYLAKNETLSVEFMNDEGIIGLEISYPKFVSWEKDDYARYEETTIFKTYSLFKTLTTRVKKIANRAKMSSPTKTYRPNFWISQDAKKVINQNRFLRSNNLTIE